VVFGPQPRDYSYKMNTKEKKAALKSALSQRVKEGKFVVLSDMAVDEVKTKSFAQKVANIGIEGKALLIDTMENTNAVLASRNNPKLNFVDALHVNVYDVVNSRYVVLSQAALDRLTEAPANANQIIRRPLVTEKSTILREGHVIAFEVDPPPTRSKLRAVEEPSKSKSMSVSSTSAER
jgi:hypothetical protein